MTEADKMDMRNMFDTHPNMTVQRIAEYFGVTVAEAKKVLMEQPA